MLADGYEPESLHPLLGYGTEGASKIFDGLVTALAVFLLGVASPFDPVFQYYGVGIFTASEADVARVRETLNLDAPVLVQFGQWLGGLVTATEKGVQRSERIRDLYCPG